MKLLYLVCLVLLARGTSSSEPRCQQVLRNISDYSVYRPETKELVFSDPAYFNITLEKCLNPRKPETELVLELVSVSGPPSAGAGHCCYKPCETTRVQSDVHLSVLQEDPAFTFTYVEGDYFLRLRQCSCSGGFCFKCKTMHCSNVTRLGEGSIYTALDEKCGNASLSFITKHTSFAYSGTSEEEEELEDTCNLEVNAFFPSCSPILPYSTVEIQIYQTWLNDSCPAGFQELENVLTDLTPVHSCNSSLCSSHENVYSGFGHTRYSFEARVNVSYCIALEQRSPVCGLRPELCSVYYYSPLRCRGSQETPLTFLPLSEPIFIGGVCGVLFLSLLLLLWTVVKCQKEQSTPNPSPEPELIKERNIPRSLTIDEMEHICRLRHQELVLVYFPDTERFKELNRLLKNWLLSLTPLNVNDVTDVYEEKYSDGPDGVLTNPDGWVANLLSDPERRVILVTSKLAYECLIHLRKGLAPPKFPNYESHSQILFSLLKFLDSEMFRGNYRRLICVRYEDLKICDRRYGSESFNIVPGTEYLIPQHLEDIARWIHPVEAKPGLWADHRPQVRNLFDSLRQYRLQEDNIFTVSFYDGENGSLLGHEYKSGF